MILEELTSPISECSANGVTKLLNLPNIRKRNHTQENHTSPLSLVHSSLTLPKSTNVFPSWPAGLKNVVGLRITSNPKARPPQQTPKSTIET